MIENPAGKMKQLIDDRASGKITSEELNTECAYWYMDCFDEIHVKPLPTIPNRLREYYNSDEAMKQKTPKEFWQLDEIKNYFNQREKIVNENKDTLIKLKECMKDIPESDSVAKSKYRQKIMEFEYA